MAMDTRIAARYHVWSCFVLAIWCLTALTGAAAPVDAAEATAAGPALTLTPDAGPCGRSVEARGTGYPPGSTVNVRGPFVPGTAINLASRSGVPQPVVAVGPDGTFALGLLPCTAATDGADRTSTQYLWTAETRDASRAFANATFTVTVATTPGLPNTGAGGAARQPGADHVAFLAVAAAAALVGVACGRKRHMGRG